MQTLNRHKLPDSLGRKYVETERSRAEIAERNHSLIAFDEAAEEDIALIRFWNRDVVLVNREEWIHSVLTEQADAFRKGPVLTQNARPLLGDGLLTSDNELNRRQRRIISPAFAHRKVGDYADVIVEYTRQAMADWTDGGVIDATNEMIAVTLAITGRLMFGDDMNESGELISEAIPILMNFAIDEMRSPWHAVRSIPPALRALILLNVTLRRRIVARRKRGEPQDEADLLDTLLWGHKAAAGTEMSDRLVRDESMTLFLAGLETVALALAWSLYLLAIHPEVAKRVQTEADALAGEPSYDSLSFLPYTLQVFKEAMRLYPPVYIVARQATREVTIGPHRLPQGANLFVSSYVRHRRPQLFPDPLRFDPDRWEASDAERRLPRYAFMPFGGGPHVCVGGHFAMMEGHLILALLARQFQFDLVPGQTIVPEPLFTLRPRYGLKLTATRR